MAAESRSWRIRYRPHASKFSCQRAAQRPVTLLRIRGVTAPHGTRTDSAPDGSLPIRCHSWITTGDARTLHNPSSCWRTLLPVFLCTYPREQRPCWTSRVRYSLPCGDTHGRTRHDPRSAVFTGTSHTHPGLISVVNIVTNKCLPAVVTKFSSAHHPSVCHSSGYAPRST